MLVSHRHKRFKSHEMSPMKNEICSGYEQEKTNIWQTFGPKDISKTQKGLWISNSSVDSSAPSILTPQVWVTSTPSTLFINYIDLCLVKKTKINKSKPTLAYFIKRLSESFIDEALPASFRYFRLSDIVYSERLTK